MIIGLTGKAGCGKDTAAAALAPLGFTKVAFAAPIKRIVSTILDVPVEQLEDRAYKEAILPWLGRSPRELMQTLGTEWGRKLVHDGVWVTLAMREAAKHQHVVFTDCRFDNEARAIREAGGVVIEIVRPGLALVAVHESEKGVHRGLIHATYHNVFDTPAAMQEDFRRFVGWVFGDRIGTPYSREQSTIARGPR